MNPSDKLSFVFHNSCHTNSYEAPSAKRTEARRKVTLYVFGKFAAEYLRAGKFYACSARLKPCSGYSGPERLRFFLYRIIGLQTEGFSVIVSFPEASALICNCCEVVKLNRAVMAEVAADMSVIRFGLAVTAIGGAVAVLPYTNIRGIIVAAVYSIGHYCRSGLFYSRPVSVCRICSRDGRLFRGQAGIHGVCARHRLERYY